MDGNLRTGKTGFGSGADGRGGVSRRAALSGLGAALGGGALLAACGGEAQKSSALPPVKFDQPVEIGFWHPQSGSNGKALEDAVAKFNTVNDKRITVRAEFQRSYTALHEKNLAVLAAGTPVELSVAYEAMVAEYMRGSACVDFDDYVKDATLGLTKESVDDIFPSYLEGLRFAEYGNKLLSFPFTKSLLTMYVNEEVLQRANVRAIPKTWAEFATALQQASRNDASMIVGIDGGAAADAGRSRTYGWGNYPSASTIMAWAYSRGGSVLTADRKQVRFAEQPFLDSFQLVEDTFKRQHAYNPPRTPGSDSDFVSNRMAFIHQSSTSRPFIRQVAKTNGREALPWRIVNIPQLDPARTATVLYGGNTAIFRTTPIKQAASWAFLKWFNDREQDVQWSIGSSYMPVRRSSAEHPTLKAYWDKEDPQGRQAFELSRYAKPEPNRRGSQEIRPVVEKALLDVMEGRQTSKAALEGAAREANQILLQMG